MRDGWARMAWIGAALVALLGASWIYARYELRDRVSSFLSQVDRLGYARGGRLPTAEEASAHVRAAAEANGLELADLEVTVEDGPGLDRAGRAFEAQAARMPGTPGIRMKVRQFHVRGRVHGERWLWSIEEPVDRTVTRRAQVRLEMPRPPPRPVPDLGAAGRRGL